MAHVSIATVTTLGQVLDEIRERTDTISEEESELYRLPLANLFHDALLMIREQMPPEMMKDFYRTEPATVTETSNLVDISALDIWSTSPTDMTYYDSKNGVAAMMRQSQFDNMKTIYSTEGLANFFIAYVSNIVATNSKLQIRTFRGTALATDGTRKLGYIRNPVKVVTMSAYPDCSEGMIRPAIELTIKFVRERGIKAA